MPEGTSRPLPEATARTRLIAVARGSDASQYPDVIEALLAGGVRSVELTLSTPGTLEQLPSLVRQFGDLLDIGVGTITTAAECERAAEAGAQFLVTPIMRQDLLDASAKTRLPMIPGGLTPTELHAGWKAGAAAVKVFPAGLVGPGYLKDLRGPFPSIQVIPSGGVDLQAAAAWLRAGATAVSVGGPLLGDALRGGSLASLTQRASQFIDVCTLEDRTTK